MRRRQRAELARDDLANRSRYAVVVTVLAMMVVLGTGTIVVLQFESGAPDADITNGWDPFRYTVVTITTVGYGDYVPVTVGGRMGKMAIMIAGVGVIGALASIPASVMVGVSDDDQDQPPDGDLRRQLDEMRAELSEIKSLLERREGA